jgi:polysaccharide export outer membrane protein
LSNYIIEPPDTLLIQGVPSIGLPTQQIDFVNVVRSDGTVGLGIYGSAFVAGLTIDQAKNAIATQLHETGNQKLEVSQIVKELNVDVLGFNSKTYYIITDGGGYGQRVYRFYHTGNETVLDAISNIGGIPREGSRKKIWVARATPGSAHPMVLPVDWKGISQLGGMSTNYQIYPGDRIFIQSDALIATDIWLNKILSPVERVMSTILLTTGIANSIHNLRNNTGN